MEKKKERNYFGWFFGTMLVLFAVLLVLKCAVNIGLSWFWVSMPLCICVLAVLFVLFVGMLAVKNNLDEDD